MVFVENRAGWAERLRIQGSYRPGRDISQSMDSWLPRQDTSFGSKGESWIGDYDKVAPFRSEGNRDAAGSPDFDFGKRGRPVI